MMELKQAKAAEAKAKKILNDRETEINDITKQINNAEAAMATAKKEMEIATNKSDLIAYKKSKQQYSDAQISTEMYSKRLDALENKPLITKEDYEKIIADIFSEMKKLSNESDTKFLELYESAHIIAEELINAGKEANRVIAVIQSDLYRNADRERRKDGDFFGRPKEFDEHYDTCYFGNTGFNHYRYGKLKESK